MKDLQNAQKKIMSKCLIKTRSSISSSPLYPFQHKLILLWHWNEEIQTAIPSALAACLNYSVCKLSLKTPLEWKWGQWRQFIATISYSHKKTYPTVQLYDLHQRKRHMYIQHTANVHRKREIVGFWFEVCKNTSKTYDSGDTARGQWKQGEFFSVPFEVLSSPHQNHTSPQKFE